MYLALQPVPPQDDRRSTKIDIISQNDIPITSATPTPTDTSSSGAPSTATSTVRRGSVYGHEEATMDNYSHIDKPLAFPSGRRPQAALDGQIITAKDLPDISHPDNDNEHQLRGPQRAISNTSMEMDLAQTSISASYGDKNAQVALGDMYRDGKGVLQDYQAAMDWYLKAVEQKDAAGQQRVGSLYDQGFGVPQNYSTAIDWYLGAAEQGNAIAQCSIGDLYYHGHGVPQDYA
ncbi:hypothetical protein BGZ47_008847 [Haplosporangium gracile]|nr:hypothetical protein BGZ47_008847 [Haplosporangium gracile]